MKYQDLKIKKKDSEVMKKYLEIIASDLPAVDRLAEAFTLVTNFYLREAKKDIEIARAMSDQENLVKEQIKHNVFLSAQGILNDAYWRVTGKKVRDDYN